VNGYGKIFTAILRSSIRIDLHDLNNDSKDDGAVTISIPEIIIPEKFNDSNFSFLIFDDLERCSISIENILGYINGFVESQDLKVVIIANEEEIDTKQERYRRIKEKLIGKTFEIVPDFLEALKYFLTKLQNQEIKKFLSDNLDIIQEIYRKADCKNLRILNQISLDFERIYNILPERAKDEPNLLKDILEILIIFSIEISCARLKPQDISQLVEKMSKESAILLTKRRSLNNESQENNTKNEILFIPIFEKYYINCMFNTNNLIFNQPFPDLLWWQQFFEKGILDKDTLEKLILSTIPSPKKEYKERADVVE